MCVCVVCRVHEFVVWHCVVRSVVWCVLCCASVTCKKESQLDTHLMHVCMCVCVYVCCRFSRYIQETEEVDMRPIFTEDGNTFVYIKVRTRVWGALWRCVHSTTRTPWPPVLGVFSLVTSGVETFESAMWRLLSFLRECVYVLVCVICVWYLQHNNLYLMSVTKRNANVALMFMFLYRLVGVSP